MHEENAEAPSVLDSYASRNADSSERSGRKMPSVKKRQIGRTVALAVIALIILGGGSAGAYMAIGDNAPGGLPAALRTSTSGLVYYPTSLPKGYYLDTGSIKSQDGMLLYSIKQKDSAKEFSVTIQDATDKFDPKVNLKKSIKGSVGTPVGTAYNISTEEQNAYVLTTNDKKLVFINSPSMVSNSELEIILDHINSFRE